MARLSDYILPSGATPYLTIDRYQEIMRLPINAFNGLSKPDEIPLYACNQVLKQRERDYIGLNLNQAENMREEELGYFLGPKYVFDEEIQYGYPVMFQHKFLIQIGTQTFTPMVSGYAIDLGPENNPNDPIIITMATTLTDASQVHVYYPGETVEIHPYSTIIKTGMLTIKIPRARLVLPDLNDDREDALSYYQNSNFLTTVDIIRVWYDDTTACNFIWDNTTAPFGWPGVGYEYQKAFPRVDDYRLAKVRLVPGSVSSTVPSQDYVITNNGQYWTISDWSMYYLPTWIHANYLSGRQSSVITEILTARLAHTLMPYKPLNCEDMVGKYWQEDREPTKVYSPYGSMSGAINAWMADSRQKVGQGGIFPHPRRW